MPTFSLFISYVKVEERVKYPKYQKLCVMAALNEDLKRTETWRPNGDKFQFLLSYIKPLVEIHSSTVSRWIKEALKETGVDVEIK